MESPHKLNPLSYKLICMGSNYSVRVMGRATNVSGKQLMKIDTQYIDNNRSIYLYLAIYVVMYMIETGPRIVN